MIGSTCFRSEYLTLQGRSDAAKRLHTSTGSAMLRRAVSDWGIFFWSLLDQVWSPSADWSPHPLPLPFPLLFSCGLLFHAFLLLELGPGVLLAPPPLPAPLLTLPTPLPSRAAYFFTPSSSLGLSRVCSLPLPLPLSLPLSSPSPPLYPHVRPTFSRLPPP